jgi:hypothetical protein
MAGPLRRFLHLERARPAGPSSAAPDARRRFGAVEPTPELPEAAPRLPTTAADRFREPAPGSLALDLAGDGEQPFVRCAACEADHARHAARCTRCGAALDTLDQRAFNERLWARMRREAEEESRAAQTRREARRQEGEEQARAGRELAEAAAEEILRRERERLGEGWLDRALRRLRALFPDS